MDDFLGLRFKYFKNDFVASISIVIRKEWEPHITKFAQLYNVFFPIKDIIDIGANFGYHTLLFSRVCTGKVHAFEPQIQNFQLLKDNVENNHIKNVTVYNLACGDENCDVNMPIYESDRQINMGDITPNLDCVNNKFSTTQSILLDEINFPSKIDLIKLDVQGWEKKVLLGARNILQTHKPALIVEFEYFQLRKTGVTCKEMFDYIREQDYYIFFLEYSYPSDHVCIHNSNLVAFREKFKSFIFPHAQYNDINENIHYGVNEKIVI